MMLLRRLLAAILYDLNFTSLRERAGTGISPIPEPALSQRELLLGVMLLINYWASPFILQVPRLKGLTLPKAGSRQRAHQGGIGEVSFCLLIVFVMLFLVRVERGRLVPLERLLPAAVPKSGRTSTDGLCQDTCGSFGGPVAWK